MLKRRIVAGAGGLLLVCSVAVEASSGCARTTSVPPLEPTTVLQDGDEPAASLPFDTLVDQWLSSTGHTVGGTNTAVAYQAACPEVFPGAVCLLVPKYASSDHCTVAAMDSSSCNGSAGTSSASQFRMVTDELSQVGMALAMAGTAETARFDEWANTVRWLQAKSADALLPWDVQVTINGSGQAGMCVRDGNDASDATARVVIALYVAANNPAVGAARLSYEVLANSLANRLFRLDQKDTRNRFRDAGRFWLAGGTAQAANALDNDNTYSYAGYFGDFVLAMLAAYRTTGEPRYASAAQDAVKNYLYAAGFTASFRVPTKEFSWDFSGPSPTMSPRGSPQDRWDDADAPRAVFLCKAAYYGRLIDAALPAELDLYCDSWMSSNGVVNGDAAYQRVYTLSGERVGDLTTDYANTGLGASLNFALCPLDLYRRLAAAARQYSTSHQRFRTAQNASTFEDCFGVYMHAFFVVNYGSAIGRDLGAFHSTIAAPDNVAVADSGMVTWNPVSGAASYQVARSCNGETYELVASEIAGTSYAGPADAVAAYKVRAVAASGEWSPFSLSASSNPSFYADFVPRQSVIHATDLLGIRSKLNAARRSAGLDPVTFAEPIAPNTVISAGQFQELRTKIDETRVAIGREAFHYQFSYTVGSAVAARALQELSEAAAACADPNTKPAVLIP